MGAYSSARREKDRRSDSYTWRGRKEGREGRRERGTERGRDGGREDQSLLTSRTHAFLYLKFDALRPLDNSDVKDLTKMNREVCIESASSVDG